MLPFEVTILGSSSATPTSERNPSAQVLNVQGRLFLIDCGEGAQMQLRRFNIRMQKIDHIFISHLHGDHFFGLPGLLGTMHLLGRTKELHIYSPEGLKQILELQNKYSETFLRYPVIHHVLDTKKQELILDNKVLSVTTIPLEHRIPCSGFLFREKTRPRNIIKEKMEELGVPLAYYNSIKAGDDYRREDGSIVPNTELTKDPPPPRAYAYCSDTCFHEPLAELVRGVDLLYHEATFASDMTERARETCHSTAKDAAAIALKAEARQLLIGHFSARYSDVSPLLEEARALFPNTLAAAEGGVYPIA